MKGSFPCLGQEILQSRRWSSFGGGKEIPAPTLHEPKYSWKERARRLDKIDIILELKSELAIAGSCVILFQYVVILRHPNMGSRNRANTIASRGESTSSVTFSRMLKNSFVDWSNRNEPESSAQDVRRNFHAEACSRSESQTFPWAIVYYCRSNRHWRYYALSWILRFAALE